MKKNSFDESKSYQNIPNNFMEYQRLNLLTLFERNCSHLEFLIYIGSVDPLPAFQKIENRIVCFEIK